MNVTDKYFSAFCNMFAFVLFFVFVKLWKMPRLCLKRSQVFILKYWILENQWWEKY